MRTTASLLILLSACICFAEEPKAQEPIEIAAYDLSVKGSLTITSIRGDSLVLPTFSGALSEWQKVVPPIQIKVGEDAHSTTWTPDSEASSSKWILITHKDPETKEPLVRALPAESLIHDKSTLFLINLTSLELKGRSDGGELWLKPNGQTFVEAPNSNLSVRLMATQSPHYSQVSLNELDTDQSFLLLFTYPHIQGSALLSHRLVRFPNLK